MATKDNAQEGAALELAIQRFQPMKEDIEDDDKLDLTLTFERITLMVDIPSWMPSFATKGTPGTNVQILKQVTGQAQSGHFLAIVGASGSGKTSLLDRLVNQPMMHGGQMTGNILINGQEMREDFFQDYCAYVTQEECLWGALTVRENLQTAMSLYNPEMPDGEQKEMIEDILVDFGLLKCADTKVGNVLMKGVSGGQKRRLSIAMACSKSPRIMFLDEPTSGLDSKSAEEVINVITHLVRSKNLMVVAVIHQPSSRVFCDLDDLLVLSAGKVAYMGPASEALEYFSQHGFQCPKQYNPADYILEITNPDFGNSERIMDLVNQWEEREAERHLVTESPLPAPKSNSCTAWFQQLRVLLMRFYRSYTRDPATYIIRIVLYSMMSFIFAIIYIDAERSQAKALDYTFLICWNLATPSYGCLVMIPAMSYEYVNFRIEKKNGMYGSWAYGVACALSQTMFVGVITIFSITPFFWINDIAGDLYSFVLFYLITWIFLSVIETLAVIFSSLFPHFILAMANLVQVLSTFFVMNGVFVEINDIPYPFRIIGFMSPHRFCGLGLTYLTYRDNTYSGYDECIANQSAGTPTGVCYGSTGDEVMDTIPGSDSDTDEIQILFSLLGMVIGYRLIHCLLLQRTK